MKSYLCQVKSKKTYTVKEAQHALEHFCTYQERTHREVEKKLIDLGMIPQAIDQITLSLLRDGFINEERFAKTYTGGKFRINKWGRIKIKQGLYKKGVSNANIAIGLLIIDEHDYQKTINDLILKKAKKIKAKNQYERKKKLLRYMQQKGFEANLVYSVFEELENSLTRIPPLKGD